jgi:hypothetical protein
MLFEIRLNTSIYRNIILFWDNTTLFSSYFSKIVDLNKINIYKNNEKIMKYIMQRLNEIKLNFEYSQNDVQSLSLSIYR